MDRQKREPGVEQRGRQWRHNLALGLVLAFCHAPPAAAQFRLPADASDPAQPITVRCDAAAAWSEGNLHVIVLRGNVVVEQGVVRAKMKDAVVWMEIGDGSREKPLPIVVYGDGDVVLQRNGAEAREPAVLLELKTRGDFKLLAGETRTRAAGDDAFYRKAVAGRQELLQTPQAREDRTQPPPLPTGNFADKTKYPVGTVAEIVPRDLNPPPPTNGPGGPPGGGGRLRKVRVAPSGSAPFQSITFPTGERELAWIISGGVSIYVEDVDGVGIVEIRTDRAVIWTQSTDGQKLITGLSRGDATDQRIEVYLEGHVQIRQQTVRGPQSGTERLLEADQAYYDIARNVALLTNAEVTASQPGIREPIHLRAQEIRQVAPDRFEASNARIFASRLPSDPGLAVNAVEASLEIRETPVRGLFSGPRVNPRTGEPLTTTELWTIARGVHVEVEGVPVLPLPYVEGDLKDPLGPLERIHLGSSRYAGFRIGAGWDLFALLGLDKPPQTRWLLDTEYLTKRGPALGSEFESRGDNLLGMAGTYDTRLRAWLLHDRAEQDILGPNREPTVPKDFRGRLWMQHRQDFDDYLSFLLQVGYQSDRNVLEEFFKREFDETNQQTFAQLRYQRDHYAFTLLAQPNIRNWVNETEWLPRGDAQLIGQSLFNDWLTYSIKGSAAYARAHVTRDIPGSFFTTPIPDEFARVRPLPPSSDFPHFAGISLGRFDVLQELSLPLGLGPFKVVPYGILDVTHYTEALDGDAATRVWGGGGVRASVPFTRVYPDVCSTLFNVRGIAHKIVFEADYRYLQSTVDFRRLPELDRLDDDATDQSRRDLRAFRLSNFAPGTRQFDLATNPRYDPQLYAIRKGIDASVEARDDLQVLTLGIHQRLQTKRGLPGREHIVDWMTLDLSASFFPDADRDNFGHSVAFLQYDYAWNVGDRTMLVSTGWVDPFADGARAFSAGVFLDRPEHMSLYLGFRKIDPIGSEAIIASTTYVFSPKYAMTLTSSYDFGEHQSLGNSIVVTRIGSDLQISLGFHYDPFRDSVGFSLELLPAIGPPRGRAAMMPHPGQFN